MFGLTTESQLSYYVAHLYKEGLSVGTVKSYLAIIRHSQIARGFGDLRILGMPRLKHIVKGVKRKATGTITRDKLPMTPGILRAI